MDQSIATACESRREQYSGTGKRPVKFPPKNCDFRPCRAPGGAGKLANGCFVVDRLARPGRRLPMPGFLDPGDGGRWALLAPRRLGFRCMGLRRLDLIGRRALVARGARLVAMAPMPVAGATPAFAARFAGIRAGYRYETERQPTVPRPARRRQTEYSGRSASRSLRPPCCRRGRRWCRRCRSCRRGRCGRCGGHNRRRDAGRRN